MLARAASALQVRPGEGRLVTWLVLLMFLPSAGGAIGSPSVEALFYARFGVQYLPYMYVALGLVTLVTSLLLTALLGRASRRRLYLTLPVVLGALLIMARVLVGLRLNWFYPVLWLGMYLLWTLQASLTWGLAGTVCNTRQAKRLFPLFGAGGILGIAVGGLITRWLVSRLGTENLLLVWAGALLISFLIVRSLTRGLRERRARAGHSARLIDDVARGFQFVRRSPLMRRIALAALLLSLLLFTIAFPFSQAVARQFPNEDALTGFLGVFQGLTTAAAFVAALFIANRFYAWLGFMGALLALPLLYFGGFGLLLVVNTFTVLAAFRFTQMAWLQGISGTAYQAIFNVVPPGWREQTRAFVDGVPTQIGTVTVGVVLILGHASLQPWHLYLGGAAAAAIAALVIWRARQAYSLALAEALRAGQPQVFLSEQQPFGGFQRDAAAVNAVLAGLADPDPVVRRVSAEVLGSVPVPAAVGAAVNALSDPDVHVRVAALHSLATAQAASAMLDIAALLADPEPEARWQAVETLRQLAGHSRGLALQLRPLLADRDPSVRSRAALALLHAGADSEAAEALLALTRSPAPAERSLGLMALADWPDPTAYNMAAESIADANPSVRCAAVRAVAHISGQGSMALLIDALGDETAMVRDSAALVLASLGKPALSAITQALAERHLEAGALQALRHLPLHPPARVLVEYARTKVSLALQYAAWQRAVAALTPATEAQRLLGESLGVAARAQALRAIEAIGLLDETAAALLVLQGLQSHDPSQQANALEMIDSWEKRDVVRPVLSLWETSVNAPAGSVAAANPANVLSPVLHDADPWLRACAAFAAGHYLDTTLQGQLARLVESDADAFVQATAAAALAASQSEAVSQGAAGSEAIAGDAGVPQPRGAEPITKEASMDTLATLSVMDRILFLRRVRLFSDLPPSELKQVAAIANEQYYLDGEVIARQGDPGDEMYIIVSGEVLVTAGAGSRSAVELARRGPGEYVGEMAIISQEPRMASLIAQGDVRVLHIEQPQFEAILRERPETSLAVMRVLCARLREVQQRELPTS
jgi:HEAT repeat protein